MAFKMGGRILGQFPLWNTADAAGSFEPFISEPARRPAVSGVGDPKGLVAVRGDPCLSADNFDCLDAVQQPPTGRPELNLIN